jgi:hypothetical protein
VQDRQDEGQLVTETDVITVRPSRVARDGLYFAIDVVLVLAVVRGLTHPHVSTTTKIVLPTVFGSIIALFTFFWVRLLRHPARLEVSIERMRYLTGNRSSDPDIVRAAGDQVRFETRTSGRSSMLVLVQAATGIEWRLPFFDRRAIAAACEQRQWVIVGRDRDPGAA